MHTKFIVVLGALMSGMGKGVVSGSIQQMLDFYGYKITPIKFDGYLNYDCGTMNPYRHGEVFVLDDSSEVDMDFGLYERFLGKDLTGELSITGGKLFSSLIEKERRGGFLGQDVQIVPHLTEEIISRIKGVASKNRADVVVIEVGGTVGDIENSYFIEAMRQLALQEKVVFVALTYVPVLSAVGEQKTKPTQIAFRSIMSLGIKPSFLVCRSEDPLGADIRKKLSLFTNLREECIIDDATQETPYIMPLRFFDQEFDKHIIEELGLEKQIYPKKRIADLRMKIGRILKPESSVRIAVVGKYVGLKDSYASVKEALVHAGEMLGTGVDILWVESESLAKAGSADAVLSDASGVLVPGGFGMRGIEGMINAVRHARENNKAYLGLCLGMQVMAVEFARNVCRMDGANSAEFDKTARHKVISIMESQKRQKYKGGTMRLGAWDCVIPKKDTLAYGAYGRRKISERHRHRYEFNNTYRKRMTDKGLVISGTTEDGRLVEMIEWKHARGVGTQAHPEFRSRLGRPAPLFVTFIKECMKYNSALKERSSKN
jgi:CTP synthase